MKHIFIVNGVAGQGVAQRNLIYELEKRSLEVYFTTCAGSAEKYIKKVSDASPAELTRYYACGGDGTLNEVINGVYGLENAEVSCIPIGSGNDFIRNFEIPKEKFMDIDCQIAGKAVSIDLIKYQEEGNPARYAVNMFNIGFDCNVVKNMANIKKHSPAKGSLAYLLSIVVTLVKKEGAHLSVEFEDGTRYEDYALLTAIGNGAFCGGGLKGIPYAVPDDGLLDVCIIKDVTRSKFISLFAKYADGSYVEDKKAKEIVIYKKCKWITLKSKQDTWYLCVDGEIRKARETKFEIVPGAIRFSLPN